MMVMQNAETLAAAAAFPRNDTGCCLKNKPLCTQLNLRFNLPNSGRKMTENKEFWRDLLIKSVCAASFLGISGAAAADQFGFQVAGGWADRHTSKVDLGFVWDPNLTWWQMGDWHFSLVGEAHAAWWNTGEGNVNRNLGEFGVTPVVRFIKGSGWIRPYLEAGIGVRVLTHARQSTNF